MAAGCIENVGNAFFLLCHVKYQNLGTLGIGAVILMLTLGYFDNWLLRHWDIVILDIEIMILRGYWEIENLWITKVLWMCHECIFDISKYWDNVFLIWHFEIGILCRVLISGGGGGHRTEEVSPSPF